MPTAVFKVRIELHLESGAALSATHFMVWFAVVHGDVMATVRALMFNDSSVINGFHGLESITIRFRVGFYE
jgi:hypothetical protein